MEKHFLKYTLMYMGVLFIGIILTGVISRSCLAGDFDNRSTVWKLSRGGQIYDNWASTLSVLSPSKTHSAYPAKGKKKGSSTWRCKECHGWDYKGRDGAYSTGSHFTGIKGINAMKGKPLSSIKSIVRDKIHGYSKSMISDKALNNLALFVSRGQLNMADYIESSTLAIKGNSRRGAGFFQTICAICHGTDGRKINFHEGKKQDEFVGTVANKNPWELLHKIRNGQPGAIMVSLRALRIQDQIDILAYSKLLPEK